MPWHCPACSHVVQRHSNEDVPRRDIVYRCSVCRLELVADEYTGKLTVAPLQPPTPTDQIRATSK